MDFLALLAQAPISLDAAESAFRWIEHVASLSETAHLVHTVIGSALVAKALHHFHKSTKEDAE